MEMHKTCQPAAVTGANDGDRMQVLLQKEPTATIARRRNETHRRRRRRPGQYCSMTGAIRAREPTYEIRRCPPRNPIGAIRIWERNSGPLPKGPPAYDAPAALRGRGGTMGMVQSEVTLCVSVLRRSGVLLQGP